MWSDFTGLVDNFIVIISLENGLIYSGWYMVGGGSYKVLNIRVLKCVMFI